MLTGVLNYPRFLNDNFDVDEMDIFKSEGDEFEESGGILNTARPVMWNNRTVTSFNDFTGKRIKVLLHARMRTGSSLAARYLGKHPDFFYSYEPGWMLANMLPELHPVDDSYQALENIRPYLVSLLNGIYTCRFENYFYFIRYLNQVRMFRSYVDLPLKLPITVSSLNEFCKSRRHILVKTIRLHNVLSADQVLFKNDVKIIHLVRDPRGMAPSREKFQRLDQAKSLIPGGVFHPMLENIISGTCEWMEKNYKVIESGPLWLKKNYLLLRYEDIADYPWRFVPKIYDFIGLPVPDEVKDLMEKEILKKPNNGQVWRQKLSFRQVQRIQELCSESVFNLFGYVIAENESQLLGNTSLVTDVPLPLSLQDLD
ncbi:carbohydrate sulfotransferase 1-like [Glandiceps talaboti]